MSNSCDIPDLVGQTLDHGRLKLTRVLGSGSNGVIYHAVDTTPGSHLAEYAVKCVIRAEKDTRRHFLQRQEIQFHRQLSRHPNIVTLHHVLEYKHYVFLVMDYCRGGDFFTYLSQRREYRGDDEFIRGLLIQILDALEACHKSGIYHRDIKPENFLVSETEEGTRLLLTDFGLATTNTHSRTFGAGSTLYMSPECIGAYSSRVTGASRPAYDTRANDVWAIGVILLSMISGHNPWNSACNADPCYVAYRRNPNFLHDMLPISDNVNYILSLIFRREHARRITLPKLREAVLRTDTFFMGPMDIMHADGYLKDVAHSYYAGTRYQAFYVPWACNMLEAISEESNALDTADYEDQITDASSSSTLDTSGPDTPELRSRQLAAEVDVTGGSTPGPQRTNMLFMPHTSHNAPLAKHQEDVSVAPHSFLRRFMDRFRVE